MKPRPPQTAKPRTTGTLLVSSARLAAALLAAGVATGCLHIHHELVIHDDGSARLTCRYSQPEDSVAVTAKAIRAANSGPDTPTSRPSWWNNRSAAAEFLAAAGFQLERYQSFTRDGRKHTSLECRVENFAQACGKGPLAGFHITETEQGHLALAADVPPPPGENARLDRLPDGFRLQLEITVPTAIVSTTGTRLDERTARWTVDKPRLAEGMWPTISVVFVPRSAANTPKTDNPREPSE